MLPQLTDFVAMLGINLVLCAGILRFLNWRLLSSVWTNGLTAACFIILWFPVGAAQLPIIAYIRGVSSDLSITLVVLAAMDLIHRVWGTPALADRERFAVRVAVAVAALFLYPLALGWGDWDAYRSGWAPVGMWVVLLAVSLLCWVKSLQLLPALVGLALLAWTAGILESSNLWDYLIDPWLATFALLSVLFKSARLLFKAA